MVAPEIYNASSKVPDTLNQTYLPKVLDSMSWNFSQGNILDYGCGPGKTGYKYILPLVEATESKLNSVDISVEMVTFAENNYPHPAINYQAGSMPDNFPFSDVQFDRVISANVFHFIKDITSTLDGLINIVKPGGQIGFTTLTYQQPMPKMMAALADSPVWGEYMHDLKDILPDWARCEKEDAVQHFKNILFTNTGMKEIYFELVHPKTSVNPEDTLNVLMSLNPCLPKVPEALRPKLREEYRQMMTRFMNYSLGGPTVENTWEYLCVIMEKPT